MKGTPFLVAAFSLLGGCALVYGYGDYQEAGAGGGTSSSAVSNGSGGASAGGSSSATTSAISSTASSSTNASASSAGGGGGGGPLPNGGACAMDPDCASTHCIAGICCATSCGACELCPSGDACGFVAPNKPGPGCAAPLVCDGQGACGGELGAACVLASDCASAHCERHNPPNGGSVCCATACAAPCTACDATGACVPLPQMMPDAACTSTTSNVPPLMGATCGAGAQVCVCDGAGYCKKEPGGACFYAFDCLDGTCGAMNVCQ